MLTILILMLLLFTIFRIMSTVCLMTWMRAQSMANDPNEHHEDTGYDDTVYELAFILIWLFVVFFGVLKGLSLAKFLLNGAKTLHEEMLERLIKSPMAFYDSVSIGNIINRFVKDLDEGKLLCTYQNRRSSSTNLLIIPALHKT